MRGRPVQSDCDAAFETASGRSSLDGPVNPDAQRVERDVRASGPGVIEDESRPGGDQDGPIGAGFGANQHASSYEDCCGGWEFDGTPIGGWRTHLAPPGPQQAGLVPQHEA
eukprot:2968772-Prymnesium_polylepis.1